MALLALTADALVVEGDRLLRDAEGVDETDSGLGELSRLLDADDVTGEAAAAVGDSTTGETTAAGA